MAPKPSPTPPRLLPADDRAPLPQPRSPGPWGERVGHWLAGRLDGERATHLAERLQASERRLALAERRLETLFQSSADALLICDAQGAIVACNDAACRLTQRSAEQLIGSACRSHVDQPPAPGGSTQLRNGEAMVHREQGNVPIELHFEPLPSDGGPAASVAGAAGAAGAAGTAGDPGHWLVRLRDISDRREAQDRLVQLANFDSLTGLPNRMLFRSRLERAMRRAQRSGRALALMFLDLDRFKVVNDSLGHEAGDRLLQHVARTLTGCLRSVDSVGRAGEESPYTISRLGGDEFTVIAENVGGAEDAALVAQRLLDALNVPFVMGDEEVVVSVSIGISLYPTDDVDLDRLIRHTDMAMYRAKQLGRGVYCFFSDDLNAAMSARLSLEGALRRAVERSEFLLYYQPKARLADGTVTGVEALLRWHSPGRGMVPPDRFIGVLEDTGLVLPVGAWVIRTACAQLAAWDADGLPPLRMAINLSARQVRHPHLAMHVEDTLREYGLAPQRLDIELTESMLMEDCDATRALLAEFARTGVRIALDDFGTGHSSLSYLKRFNVHTLKVDRSFVGALPDSSEDRAIAQAVIVMAHSLGMSTVAEGVETSAQLQALGTMGCDEVQGYLVGRPMPADELAPWLVARLHREYLERHRLAAGGEPTVTRFDIECDGHEMPDSAVERTVTLWTVGGPSLESADATAPASPAAARGSERGHECGHERGNQPGHERGPEHGREHVRHPAGPRPAGAPAAGPEPRTAGGGHAAGRAAGGGLGGAIGAHPGRGGLGQDAGADHAHRVAAADRAREPGAGAGRDLHQQGRQGDAGAPRGHAAGERARHVDRHVSWAVQPLPARALEAGGAAAVVPDPRRPGQRRRRQTRRQGVESG
jgi:diguanylate cyclase (GGDEF)-like protein/PAS domain S-box-containing protein